MKLYTFVHRRMDHVSKGVQGIHATAELFNKYVFTQEPTEALSILNLWSVNYKTVVVMHAGVTPDIHELIEFLEFGNCPYPWSFFKEDESFGELVTCIGLVLPEKIYEVAAMVRRKEITFGDNDFLITSRAPLEMTRITEKLRGFGCFEDFDLDMISRLNTYRLAT